jgi:GntR family transcriptional repressor for pyruvate dehydrogenase complex
MPSKEDTSPGVRVIGADAGGAPLSRLRPARRRSLTEEIVTQLLHMLADSPPPEARLPTERVLCERLEVSRASVREALSALSQLGVVETRGKGKYGSTAGAHALLLARETTDVYEQELLRHPLEARQLLEPHVAALAARRRTDKHLAEIEHWLSQMQGAQERDEQIVSYDSAFHVSIARATHNPTLVRLVRTLTDSLSASRALSFSAEHAKETAISGHAGILDALRDADPARARRAMTRHLDEVERLIRASLTDPDGGPEA